MAYAESMGIAAFLNNLQQNLMANALRKQQIIDDERKIEAERTARAIDAGRLMYQQQAPVVAPLTLSGQPTISGNMDLNGFIQNPMPGLGIPEPAPTAGPLRQPPLSIPEQYKIAELRKPTLENPDSNQQAEILKAVREGRPVPERYVTIAPKRGEGPADTIVSGPGGVTETWKKNEITPYQAARLEIEKKRKDEIRSKYKDAEFLKAFARAQWELGDNLQAMRWSTDDREKFVNDRVIEILEAKKSWETTGKRPPAPAVTPVKIRVKRISDGNTGSMNESDFDPSKYTRL